MQAVPVAWSEESRERRVVAAEVSAAGRGPVEILEVVHMVELEAASPAEAFVVVASFPASVDPASVDPAWVERDRVEAELPAVAAWAVASEVVDKQPAHLEADRAEEASEVVAASVEPVAEASLLQPVWGL